MKHKQIIIISVLIIIGALGGFLYWRFIGCQSNSCPLTSTWYKSAAFGGLIGYLVSDSFKTKMKKETENKE